MKVLISLALLVSMSHVFADNHQHASPKQAVQLADQSNKPDRVLTLVNHQFEGTKQWLPGTLVVKAGETVDLVLINNTESGIHGFRIRGNDGKTVMIQEDVAKGKMATLRFKAGNKGDIYQFDCQLHPAHVGGQIIVL